MEIGRLLLIGGAAFLGYEFFLKPKATTPPSTGGTQPGTTPPVTQPTPEQQTTQSLISSMLAKNGMQMGTVDDFNWYYAQVRGVAPPSPEDWGITADNRGRLMTFPEYWGLATSHGLSNIVPMGLGARSGYVRTDRLAVMEAE